MREPPRHVLGRLGGRDQVHPRGDLDRERQRVGVVQPRLPVGERHHIGEPGERQERRPRLPLDLLKPEHRAAVVHGALVQLLDLPRAPPAAAGRRRRRVAQRAHQGVPEKPRHLARGGMPGGQRGRGQRPAEPLGLLGPLADLARGQRVLLGPAGALGGPERVAEVPEQAAGQLRPNRPLAQPDPEVDLLRPEVLRPHVLVDLVQVLAPARTAVGRRVQAGRPLHHRVRPVRDPQVHLGVLHPDRGQRHGDVGGQRLALVGGGELVRDRRHPVVRPRVRVGQQHPVVEVSDRQAAAPLRLPAHHVPRVVAPAE